MRETAEEDEVGAGRGEEGAVDSFAFATCFPIIGAGEGEGRVEVWAKLGEEEEEEEEGGPSLRGS